MKKQTAKHGGSISIPRRGGFSLSVGKYVVKGVRCKKECLDLCCKYTCLRHIWQYAGGIIHRNLGCAQLRWQNQRRTPRQRKNCAAIDKDRASPSNDNFLITVRFFGSFPLLFTVWFAVTKEVIQMDKDSLAHSNHKRIHLCLCFYVSEW